jgi:hypothetical protein
MPFPRSARQARDPDVSVWLRMSGLKGCVASFCGLTGLSFRATLERLGLTWTPVIPRDPPTDAFLRRTLDALERERNVYLHALRTLEHRRIRAKLKGRRQLSRVEREARAELRRRAEAAVERVAAIAAESTPISR